MFLANENFPRPSITLLRNQGYEIKSIQKLSPGIPDHEVLQLAVSDNLIILTFDKDYGELIFRHSTQHPPSVIYFRDKGNNPLFAGEVLLNLLPNPEINFKSCFTVIEEQNVRQRFYKR